MPLFSLISWFALVVKSELPHYVLRSNISLRISSHRYKEAFLGTVGAVVRMQRPVVFGNPVLHNIKQHVRIVDDAGMLQLLGRMDADYSKRLDDSDYAHTRYNNGLHASGRVLEHKTLFQGNVQLVGFQQVYL